MSQLQGQTVTYSMTMQAGVSHTFASQVNACAVTNQSKTNAAFSFLSRCSPCKRSDVVRRCVNRVYGRSCIGGMTACTCWQGPIPPPPPSKTGGVGPLSGGGP